MRNEDLYSPACADKHAKKLVMSYAMRGLMNHRGEYTTENLLARQYKVYEEWLAAARESRPGFDCGFYEWLGRDEDTAFIFKPGDLVKHGGRYCIVVRRCTREVTWRNSWRLCSGRPVQEPGPMPMNLVELKDSDNRVWAENALAGDIEPADIPPEVFALACGRAKDCPMLKGGSDGE